MTQDEVENIIKYNAVYNHLNRGFYVCLFSGKGETKRFGIWYTKEAYLKPKSELYSQPATHEEVSKTSKSVMNKFSEAINNLSNK